MNVRAHHILRAPEGDAPPPGGGASAPPPPAPPGHGIAWLPADLNDADILGHVQNKAWQSPVDAVRGHRELEKLLGADRAGRTFTIPKDDDVEGWKGVWAKLGAPATVDGYQLPIPEGQSGDFAKQAAAWFHELGVPAKQAQGLAAKWNAHMAAEAEAVAREQQEALTAEHKALENDWGSGPAAEQQKEIARRAAVKLGLDEQSIGALEKVAGFSKVMKAFAKMGELMGEAKFIGADQGGSFGLTPEAAKARKSQLLADKEWGKKAMNPASAEWAEMARLDQIIANSMQQAA